MTRVNSAQVKSEALPSRIVANFALAVVALARPPRAKLPAPPRRAVAAVLLTCMAIIASMFLLDRTASDWARHLPGWFIEAFEQITDFGLSGWFLYPLGVILLGSLRRGRVCPPRLSPCARGCWRHSAARFGFLFLAIAVPGLFVTIVKRLIGRARPMSAEHDPFVYVPFVWQPAYASMPSGHATTAAAAAVAIGALWPRARAAMWIYALRHHGEPRRRRRPSPERRVAGAVIGGVGRDPGAPLFCARRLAFTIGPDGAVNAMAGPSPRRIKPLPAGFSRP